MNKNFIIFLLGLPKIGNVSARKIASCLDSHGVAFDDRTLLSAPEACLKEAARCNPKYVFSHAEIEAAKSNLMEIMEACVAYRVSSVGFTDATFPKQLNDIQNPPACLFYQGALSIVSRQTGIAVVGTRTPTKHGYKIGEGIGEMLADAGVTVVSGLATGCDTAGHKGCLKHGGKTAAVMAEGLHTIYPESNKGLAEEILEKGGCLLSEYAPGKNAYKTNFVQRDRLQSGLSSGVIVIETGIVGGTMHTVQFALKQGRLVGAYRHDEKFARCEQAKGNASLISSGQALPLRTRKDLEAFIAGCRSKNGAAETGTGPSACAQMTLFETEATL